ncbi:hypothetical protein PoB_007109200 [Plakobranchus ocellatus]|uniref:Uncharacterized protein n=1 Tax=Plakobranchus ocellatus TaxID=259542 RepID=A0AAV4DKL4_9GAST|nr:hypothetical protein PoB_007109200 [Plakobranchus ocellatus]
MVRSLATLPPISCILYFTKVSMCFSSCDTVYIIFSHLISRTPAVLGGDGGGGNVLTFAILSTGSPQIEAYIAVIFIITTTIVIIITIIVITITNIIIITTTTIMTIMIITITNIIITISTTGIIIMIITTTTTTIIIIIMIITITNIIITISSTAIIIMIITTTTTIIIMMIITTTNIIIITISTTAIIIMIITITNIIIITTTTTIMIIVTITTTNIIIIITTTTTIIIMIITITNIIIIITITTTTMMIITIIDNKNKNSTIVTAILTQPQPSPNRLENVYKVKIHKDRAVVTLTGNVIPNFPKYPSTSSQYFLIRSRRERERRERDRSSKGSATHFSARLLFKTRGPLVGQPIVPTGYSSLHSRRINPGQATGTTPSLSPDSTSKKRSNPGPPEPSTSKGEQTQDFLNQCRHTPLRDQDAPMVSSQLRMAMTKLLMTSIVTIGDKTHNDFYRPPGDKTHNDFYRPPGDKTHNDFYCHTGSLRGEE